MSASNTEADAMRRAIALSALGIGTTSPNPPVGCVILDQTGRPAGEGYHRRKGESHAEVHALTAAGVRTVGGTAVVTLEPCNHHGRTPPCHQALIDAGIARVLIAVIDPTSRGIGGAAKLRDAGIDVEVGLLAEEARVVLQPWLTTLTTGRPRIIWAYEITNGHEEAIPDEVVTEAGLRHQVDAVVHADGRVEEGVDGAHGQGAFALPQTVPASDPAETMDTLYKAGARTILLHGGHELAAPYLDRQLIDEARMFLATSTPSLIVPAAEDPAARPLTTGRIQTVRKLSGGAIIETAQPPPPSDGTLR